MQFRLFSNQNKSTRESRSLSLKFRKCLFPITLINSLFNRQLKKFCSEQNSFKITFASKAGFKITKIKVAKMRILMLENPGFAVYNRGLQKHRGCKPQNPYPQKPLVRKL